MRKTDSVRFTPSLRAQCVEQAPAGLYGANQSRVLVYGHKLTWKTWHCHHSESWPTYLTVYLSVCLSVSFPNNIRLYPSDSYAVVNPVIVKLT